MGKVLNANAIEDWKTKEAAKRLSALMDDEPKKAARVILKLLDEELQTNIRLRKEIERLRAFMGLKTEDEE